MANRIEPKDSVYFTPAESGTNWIKYVEDSSGEGMKWGTTRMNNRILPLGNGKMGAIIALPGAGKTTLAVTLVREYVKELVQCNVKNKAVLYISVDQVAEDIVSIFLASKEHTVTDFAEGRVSHEELEKLSAEFVEMPLYIFGKSSVEQRKHQPRMTYENILLGIDEMERHVHCTPALIVVDYLQNIPIERHADRREQVGESVIQMRELCLSVPCPILNLVQAGRASQDREIKIPTPQDSQHNSAIEQEHDVMLGIWKPKLTEIGKQHVEFGGRDIPITDDLLFAGLTKQRRKPAGFVFPLNFNGGTLELNDIDINL